MCEFCKTIKTVGYTNIAKYRKPRVVPTRDRYGKFYGLLSLMFLLNEDYDGKRDYG
jgi:hypothetical protein